MLPPQEFEPVNVSMPAPIFVNAPGPPIDDIDSKAPPLTVKMELPASVTGVLIVCVPLSTVTFAMPLLPLSVKLPLRRV